MVKGDGEAERIFKLVAVTGIHLILREEHNVRLDKISDEQKEEFVNRVTTLLENFDPFLQVLDKTKLVEEAADIYWKIFEDTDISDGRFVRWIEEHTAEDGQANHKLLFDGMLWLALRDDGEISVKEKELLSNLYGKFSISRASFNKYLKAFLKRQEKLISKPESQSGEYGHETKGNRRPKQKSRLSLKNPMVVAAALGIVMVLFALFYPLSPGRTKKAKPPAIAFRRVLFERYIAAGNFRGGERSKSTGKIVVFFVKGHADVMFDTQHVDLKQEETDNEFYVVYRNQEAEQLSLKDPLPFLVQVSLDKSYQVLNVEPQAISKQAAAEIGKPVGMIVGMGTGLIGGSLLAEAGRKTGSTIFSLVAGIGGGALLGGLSGYGAYTMTTKFLTGLKLTKSIGQADKDLILAKAKDLIAAEILWGEDHETMKQEFEEYVKTFYSKFGIKIQKIKYE